MNRGEWEGRHVGTGTERKREKKHWTNNEMWTNRLTFTFTFPIEIENEKLNGISCSRENWTDFTLCNKKREKWKNTHAHDMTNTRKCRRQNVVIVYHFQCSCIGNVGPSRGWGAHLAVMLETSGIVWHKCGAGTQLDPMDFIDLKWPLWKLCLASTRPPKYRWEETGKMSRCGLNSKSIGPSRSHSLPTYGCVAGDCDKNAFAHIASPWVKR